MSRVLHDLGSAGAADYCDFLGELPKKYFTAGYLEGADRVSGATVAETILTGVTTCHACVIACGRVVRLEDGQKRKGPEYETLAGFGPNMASPTCVCRPGWVSYVIATAWTASAPAVPSDWLSDCTRSE
jgi:aldehyde:ferredoxin oxidoreductase